jgi:hypothetical protein
MVMELHGRSVPALSVRVRVSRSHASSAAWLAAPRSAAIAQEAALSILLAKGQLCLTQCLIRTPTSEAVGFHTGLNPSRMATSAPVSLPGLPKSQHSPLVDTPDSEAPASAPTFPGDSPTCFPLARCGRVPRCPYAGCYIHSAGCCTHFPLRCTHAAVVPVARCRHGPPGQGTMPYRLRM